MKQANILLLFFVLCFIKFVMHVLGKSFKKLEGDLSCSNRLSKGVQALLRLHTTSLAMIDYDTGLVSTTNSFMFFYPDIIIVFFPKCLQ